MNETKHWSIYNVITIKYFYNLVKIVFKIYLQHWDISFICLFSETRGIDYVVLFEVKKEDLTKNYVKLMTMLSCFYFHKSEHKKVIY